MANKVDRKNTGSAGGSEGWPFGNKNYLLFGLALLVTTIGFVLLGVGDVSWAPVLLVVGYCVLMPLAIIVKDRPEPGNSEETSSD